MLKILQISLNRKLVKKIHFGKLILLDYNERTLSLLEDI